MSKPAFTPGPWTATRANPAEGYDVWWITAHLSMGYHEICDVPGHDEANAHLIAASPTMFEYVSARAHAGDVEAKKIVEAINAPR